MKFILHIGQSKTGTTSLQHFLSSNREALKRQGILYPDVQRGGVGANLLSHNTFAEAIWGRIRYPYLEADAYMDQFTQDAQAHECHTILLSAESFFGTPQIWECESEDDFWRAKADMLEKLSGYLSGHDTHIIVYLRPQIDWFESAVPHTIRYEGLMTKKLYESDEQLFEYFKPHMDYTRHLQLWRDIIHPIDLQAIPFQKQYLEQDNTIADFLKRTSIEQKDLNQGALEDDQHQSLDRRLIWLKKELNKKQHNKAQERAIITILDQMNAEYKTIEKYSVDYHLRERIIDFFAPLNEDLNKDFINYGALENLLERSQELQPLQEDEKEKIKKDFISYFKKPSTQMLIIRNQMTAFLRNYMPVVHIWLKKILTQAS